MGLSRLDRDELEAPIKQLVITTKELKFRTGGHNSMLYFIVPKK